MDYAAAAAEEPLRGVDQAVGEATSMLFFCDRVGSRVQGAGLAPPRPLNTGWSLLLV